MKILIYIYGLNIGGAETFILNILNNIDNKYKFDFVIQQDRVNNKKIEEYISTHNCEVFSIPPFYKNFNSSKQHLARILKENKYDCVHMHCNSLINCIPLMVCNKLNIPLIIHAHNEQNNIAGFVGHFFHIFNRYIFLRDNFIFVACSKKSGYWLFRKKNFIVIPNGIDFNKFVFNKIHRKKIKNSLGINCQYVIGDVSRFVDTKNHIFIINVFNELLKINKHFHLILVGDGPTKNDCINLIGNLGLQKKVTLVGSVDNPEEYYSCFDALLRPSKFEGLPFSLLEAQASGLPILTSDVVTKACTISDKIIFKSLDDSYKEWAHSLVDMVFANNKQSRLENNKFFENSIYNISNSVNLLQEIYNKARDKFEKNQNRNNNMSQGL